MQFTPKTKSELVAKNLLPKGWYDFEVMAATDKVSKAGNEMIEAKLRVFDPSGGEKHIFDYLMEAVPEKLFDFCEAVGLAEKYHAGTLTAADCVHRAAKVKIAIDDKNEDFPPKNVARGYAAPSELIPSSAAPPSPTAAKAAPPAAPDDDDIPF